MSPELMKDVNDSEEHLKNIVIDLKNTNNNLNEISKSLQVVIGDVNTLKDEEKASLKSTLTFWDKYNQVFLFFLALYLITLAFAYIFLVTFGIIPEANKEYANMSSSFILGTVISTVMGFFFGSRFKDTLSNKRESDKSKPIAKSKQECTTSEGGVDVR